MFWVVTLVGIAAMTVTSEILFTNAVIRAREHSTLVDLAGRQRTLSQQIALYSGQYIAANTEAGRLRYLMMLRSTVNQMRDDYGIITASLDDNPRFHALHLGNVMPAQDIYNRYWSAAEDLAEMSNVEFRTAAPFRFVMEYAQTVLTLADKTVQIVLDENVAAISRLDRLNDFRMLVVFGLIVAQILFILVPSLKRIAARGATLEHEIAERKRAQAELTASEARFRSLIESAPVGIVQLDLAGTIQWTNARWTQISGISQEAAVGRAWTTAIHPEDQVTMIQVGRAMTSEPHSLEFEVRMLNADKVVTVQGETIPMYDAGGAVQGFLATLIDITQRKLAERQALKLEAERQRIKVLGEFIRDTSHDLRTPLSVIRSGLYLCSRTTDVERIHAKVAVMDEHVSYLNSTIDKLQEMAVLDTMTDLTLVPTNITLLLREAMAGLSEQAAAAGIEAVLALEPDLPQVLASPDKLIQALRAVLDNAVRFSNKGARIVLSGRCADGRLRIEVVDNGIGMTQTQSARVFDRFYKVEAARGVGGAGLGLAIAKRVVELHGGQIGLSSEPGVGTTVMIDLPLVPTLRRDVS